MFDREKFICEFLTGSLSGEQLVEAAKRLEDRSLADQIVRDALIHDLLLMDAALVRDQSSARLAMSLLDETGTEAELLPVRASTRAASRHVTRSRALLGAGVAVVCLWAAFLYFPNGAIVPGPDAKLDGDAPPVARFSRSVNARWAPASQRWSVGDTLRAGDRVELSDGRVELIYESGAVMSLAGPVALEVKSAASAALQYGTATTRVEPADGGAFELLTPSASVVDQGTEFGVRVKPDGITQVAVFEGAVDLHPMTSRNALLPVRRLTTGEALQGDEAGVWERLVSVDDDAFPFGSRLFAVERSRPPVSLRITDNRRSSESPSFYRICPEGLVEDCRAFVDRTHQWNALSNEGLPYFLRGADYVQTFNDDKSVATLAITLELTRPAMLYLFYDDRLQVPEWLSETFEDTGSDLGLDEGTWDPSRKTRETAVGAGRSIDHTFSIWRRRVANSQSIELGPIGEAIIPSRSKGRNMFGIAAQPLN